MVRKINRFNLTLYEDTVELIKGKNIELSGLVRDLLDNYCSDINVLKRKEIELTTQLEQVKQHITQLTKEEQDKIDYFKRLNSEQIKWIKSTIQCLKDNPKFFEARLRYWNNTYDIRLSKDDFKQLLDMYDDIKDIIDGAVKSVILREYSQLNKQGGLEND